MHLSIRVCVSFISVGLLLASCSPIVDTRGHSPEQADFRQIIAGQTRDEDVQALLGSPSAKSTFGDETWYYITQKKETSGMLATEVVEQHVTAISFDKDHLVTDISEIKKEDGKPVQIVNQTTPTEGHKMGIMEQMLGNFGRFNTPGRSIDPRGLGH